MKKNNIRSQQEGPTPAQKAGVVFLSILALVVIIGWMIDLGNNIRTDTAPVSTDDNENSQANSDSSCRGEDCDTSEEELKNMDTDGDGLSDWEELHVYDTSPYLEDTDGDGIADGEEVERDLDPLCPEGEDCGDDQDLTDDDLEQESEGNLSSGTTSTSTTSISTSTTSTSTSEIEADDMDMELSSSSDLFQDEEKIEGMLQGEAGAEELRQILLQGGMDKNMLDQLSDQELMQSYQQVLDQ